MNECSSMQAVNRFCLHMRTKKEVWLFVVLQPANIIVKSGPGSRKVKVAV